MLRVAASERLDLLADQLAHQLADPLDDPMTPEWVVVASSGMDRWLRLALARRLGASAPGATDGVAANLDLLFPARLWARVLGTEADGDDPWQVDRLAWAVLDVLAGAGDDPRLRTLATLPDGATWWGRARRIADLFDRYHTHRPTMVRAWAAGRDVNGAGTAIDSDAVWQPHLWRLVRDRIGAPSAAELLPERLAELRAGVCADTVPDRVALFGLTTIPGGAPFQELLHALATARDVHLLMLQPSAGAARRVRAATLDAIAADGARPVLRSADRSVDVVTHPLLRSWGRPARETDVLLAELPLDTTAGAGASAGVGGHGMSGDHAEADTVLGRLQADLRRGDAPSPTLVPRLDDRSVRFHACHGATRQVEVLRDELLGLLAADPTLREDDIVVLCPALDQFAPFIEAVLGPSAPAGTQARPWWPGRDAAGPPQLAYRIADRSLRDVAPVLGALSALLDLLAGRCSAPTLLDVVSLPPVRARFGFDDTDLTAIADWIEAADVRWGLDGAHRARWNVPAEHIGGSWQAAIDRLLLGIAITDDPDAAIAVGDVLPLGVEGSGVAVAGRLADLLARLRVLVDEAAVARPAADWADLLTRATDELFAIDPSQRWQQLRLAAALAAFDGDASIAGTPVTVPLTLADVRRLLAGQSPGLGGRPDLFRGGITFASLSPLRAVPHRVVCLLGMDEGAFGSAGVDGDDLMLAEPHLGDRDRRAELRQGLLESVLAAGDHLVVVRTGHSVITNLPVPPATPVAELRDAVAASFDPDHRSAAMRQIVRAHPRQSFDERNFLAKPATADAPAEGPHSFDPVARDGAAARSAQRRALTPLVTSPLTVEPDVVLELADLRDFVDHPPRFFLRRTLGVSVPPRPERDDGRRLRPGDRGERAAPITVEGRDLLLEPETLEFWAIKERLLRHRLAGGDVASFAERERARGSLPPGRLADECVSRADDAIGPVVDTVLEHGVVPGGGGLVTIDTTLRDGRRLVGTVADAAGVTPGPVRAYPSATNGKRRLAAWLDLLVLTAQDPTVAWTSLVVTTSGRKAGVDVEAFRFPIDDPADRHDRALSALDVLGDLHDRGRCEPLPLFPKLSPALHKGSGFAAAWSSSGGGGDGDDRWIALAFADADLRTIRELPLGPADPPGPGDARAQRYAAVLWDTVEQSIAPPPEAGPDAAEPEAAAS